MKPEFLTEVEMAFKGRRSVILTFNTEDFFYWPEERLGPARLSYFLASYFSRSGYRVGQYIPTIGFSELSNFEGAVVLRGEPREFLPELFRMLRRSSDRWIVILPYGESFGSSVSYSSEESFASQIIHFMALDDSIRAKDTHIVLITYHGSVPDLLAKSTGFQQITVGLPKSEERLEFIKLLEELRDERGKRLARLSDELSPETLASLTNGMSLLEIENLYRSLAGSRINLEDVRKAKATSLRSLGKGLLEVSEPREGFESVAGLRSLKELFKHLEPQIKARSSLVPQGILLQGVYGCGKSHVVRAVAAELKWPLVELRNIRGPLVGQSEQQLEYVITLVEQLKPVVLFFDEVDQTLGQRGTGFSGDSGVSERILARIFNWLGSMHLRGEVLFIAATNRPDLLDQAFLDRFRVTIPVLCPSRRDIEELIPIYLRKFKRVLGSDVSIEELSCAFASKNLTGRAIQEVLVRAGLRADREAGKIGSPILKRHIMSAIGDELIGEDPLEKEFITLLSLKMTSSNSYLPWNSFEGLRSREEIPPYLLEAGIVRDDGRLNLEALNSRLEKIKQIRTMEKISR